MDSEQQLAHDSTEGLELLEAAFLDEEEEEGPDIGVVARGAERGHIEGHASETEHSRAGKRRGSAPAGPRRASRLATLCNSLTYNPTP